MKTSHKTFVNAMAKHGDPVQAYTEAYPRVSPASAKSAAYRLLKNEEINKAVAFDKLLIDKKSKAAAIRAGATRRKKELSTIERKREVLAAIIDGDFRRGRIMRLDGELVEVYEDLPSSSVLRAIELDCRLEAGYDWAGRAASKKEAAVKPKAGPGNPVAPDGKDITGAIVFIGATPSEIEEDLQWLNRYIAWKKQNPAKVKEWIVANEARVDTYVQWDEDTEGFPRSKKQREGNTTLVQIARFTDQGYGGPFIPGESEIVLPAWYSERSARDNVQLVPEVQPMKPGTGEGEQHGENENISQQIVTIPPPPTPPQPVVMTKNDQAKTAADTRWEWYKELNAAYKNLSPHLQSLKEKWFRGLNAENQRAHLQPLLDKQKNDAA